MGDKSAISGSSSESLPRWLSKTHSRYDPDDIAFSPPSEDGATFFSFHLDSSTNSRSPAHKSTFDKINEELGLTEIPGEPRLGLTPRSSGLCLSTELLDERIEHQSRSDLLQSSSAHQQQQLTDATSVDSRITGYNTGSNSFNPITAAAKKLSEELRKEKPSGLRADDDDFDFDIEDDDDTLTSLPNLTFKPFGRGNQSDLNQLDSHGDSKDALSLFDRLKNIVPRTAGPSPQSSPKPLRKTSVPGTPFEYQLANSQPQPSSGDYFSTGGVVVNRSSKMPLYNSFFFRPNEGDTANQTASNSTPASAGIVAPAGAMQQTAEQQATVLRQQEAAMASAAAAAAAATPVQRLRRPKPSRLREMNFWAPTSM